MAKKFYLLVICISIACINAISDEVFFDEDKPYDVQDITIPGDLWNLAMNPTPILKSPVTIVVPVHVPQDEEEPEEEATTESIDENEILTQEAVAEAPSTINAADAQDVVITEPSVAPPVVAEVSQDPISTVAPAVAGVQQVNGSLLRFPCTCRNGQCGCCTGAILQRWQTKACGNITFVPEDFIFDVRLNINDNTVVRRRVSASNPPPICFNPRRAPFVEVCAEISNIRIRNRNAFACLDINANIGGIPIYSASFRCFGLGASGVQTGLKPKPVSSGPTPINLYGNNNDEGGGGFIQNAAGAVLGTGVGQFFGDDGDDDDDGPLDAIGDIVGDLFEK